MGKRLLLISLLGALPLNLPATPGRITVLLSLAPGSRPEGLAVHQTGRVFVGNRRIGATRTTNEILNLAPDGAASVFATLPSTASTAQSLLGLAVDPAGDVYAALVSFDGNHGVWHVSPDGRQLSLLPGSASIVFPNGLAFDHNGNLYVTDSFGGAVWRSERGGPFARWIQDPLLLPLPADPFGAPLPGANGIAFVPPDRLYIGNTEKGLIVEVTIEPDGSPGAMKAVTRPFAVPTVDGIAADVFGRIYAVLPGFSLLAASPLVRVEPESGAVTPLVTDALDAVRFDTPLSVAFGAQQWGVKTVLVTNGDLPIVPGGPGPGIIQVEVDAPGGQIP